MVSRCGSRLPRNHKVLTSPPEAMVFLDDKNVGVTPLILPRVAVGPHRLKVVLKDHASTKREVTLSYDDWDRGGQVPLKEEFALALAAVTLQVAGIVDGATIFIEAGERRQRSHPASTRSK